jgi:O-methyltransferase
MKLRSFLSTVLNRLLGRVGYALVRTNGDRTTPYHTHHLGVRFAYEHILIPDAYAPWAIDEEFLAVWEAAEPNTLVDIYRSHELYELVREVADLPGDILEVGVWRGGTGAVLAAAARRYKPAAQVWLCDTFTGVVKAGEHDPTYRGGEHADTSSEIVYSLLKDLALTNVTVLTGIFPNQTAIALGDVPIALCHVDVDVYQSAADTVAWAVPRMRTGSILVFDDYGFSSCKGITRLVEELRTAGSWQYIYNVNKHAILIKR